MAKHKSLLSSTRSGSSSSGLGILIALICVSIVLVTLYSREGASGPVHTLRAAAQVVAMPFEWAGSQLMRPFDALGNALRNVSADSATLAELEEENTRLTAQLGQLNEFRAENERLQQMLSLTSTYGMTGVAARVIGGSSGDWDSTIVIDKGTNAGIAVDMPVVDGYGVVGQVTAVSPISATVTLLDDPGSGVSALLQGSRETGVLQGSVDGALHLDFVPTGISVSVGELVVTSGLGGVYPTGILLGTVASVSSNPTDMYHNIVVAPAVRVGNYEEVYVMTGYDAGIAAGAADTLLSGAGAAQGGA